MTSSIADNVRKCIESFENVASNVLGSPNAGDDTEGKLTNITEELARFKVWSGNIGAHRKGRSSLDYRLRDASNLQEHVNDLLEDLNKSLVDAHAILTGDKEPWDKAPENRIPSVFPKEILDPGDFDFESEIDQIFADIVEVLDTLCRISVSLRNPTPHDRFMSFASTDTSCYERNDIEHVREKYNNAEDFIVQRLGKALSHRRQYFKYRESHRHKLAMGLDIDSRGTELGAQSTIASSIPQAMKETDNITRSLEDIDEDQRSDSGLTQTSFATTLTGGSGRLQQYQRHVGRHQEDLALFALPSSTAEDQEVKADPEDKEWLGSEDSDDIDDDSLISTEVDPEPGPEKKFEEEAELRKKFEEEARIKAELEARKKIEDEKAAAAAAEAAKKKEDDDPEPGPEKNEEEREEAEISTEEANKKSQGKDKAPIRFKDAVGRKFSFPFHLCQTWQGMEDLIKQAFLHVDVIGPHVQAGHYDLLGPNGEILLPTIWENVIKPDWAVTMHMWPMEQQPPVGPGPMKYDGGGEGGEGSGLPPGVNIVTADKLRKSSKKPQNTMFGFFMGKPPKSKKLSGKVMEVY
ncbi:hypothetical protein DL771_000064 [Monosporascus sp. 5C6A]|nr:hypothetical protein DL771_000064 [Monosporascus sp. 5C6A]